MKQVHFPRDFLWGASTSGHQVDGNAHDQWTVWEEHNAERAARDAQKRLKHLYSLGEPLPWSEIEPAATDPDNYRSGKGDNHYELYEGDFDLLETMHMNAFRFSIEWARLEPQEGQWDEAAIRHYRQYLAALQWRGIEAVPTLWHWTVPEWFAQKGGFARKSNLHYFEAFVARVAQEFGQDFEHVLVLNEPNVYASMSYAAGFWPPERKNPLLAFRVYRNLLRAHQSAYAVLKKANPKLQVGTAMALGQIYAHKPHNPFNRWIVKAFSYCWNWWFLNQARQQMDFIGVNFYSAEHLDWHFGKHNPPDGLHNDLGWYMEPSALFDLLQQLKIRYKNVPLMITENGLADGADKHRKWWLQETIAAMQKALANGVPLIGYLHWSLLDNFEWAYGWWPKFGLVAVDRKSGKRTMKPSARWFGDQIKYFRQ